MRSLRILTVIALLLIWTSCQEVSETEAKLIGKWDYKLVTKAGAELFPVADGDVMELTIDHRFSYKIASADKDANGNWTLFGDTIALEYEPEGNVRNFIIDKISDDSLVFHEGDLSFHYTKSE